MEARISFTDRFKKQTTKPLTTREKGELRWAKLEEAEQSGELQRAPTRVGLGLLVGMANDAAAYKWVSNLIGRGYIAELPTEVRGEHEYKLIAKPSFRGNRPRKKAGRKNKRASAAEIKQRESVVRQRAEDGSLEAARNLSELTRLVEPYVSASYKTIHVWLSNRLKNGWLKAEETGKDVYGIPVYRYSLANELKDTQSQAVKSEPTIEITDSSYTAVNVVVTKGDMTIKVELAEVEQATNLITTILKGE